MISLLNILFWRISLSHVLYLLNYGKSKNVGLLVYKQNNGTYWAVCDDGWDMADAKVACKSLGFQRALSFSTKVTNNQVLVKYRYFQCTGSETDLLRCPHEIIKQDECNNKELVSIICDSSPVKSLVNNQIITEYAIAHKSIRTMVVKVSFFYKNSKMTLSEWTIKNSYVYCGQIGLPLVEEFKMKDMAVNSSKCMNLNCSGYEHHTSICKTYKCHGHDTRYTSIDIKCVLETNNQSNFTVKLVGGWIPSLGRIEIHMKNNGISTICDDYLTYAIGNLFCRSLGYGTVKAIHKNAYFGIGISRKISKIVKCVSSIYNFSQSTCVFSQNDHYCDHRQDVGIECNFLKPKDVVNFVKLQISSESAQSSHKLVEGIVNVSENGIDWYEICSIGWKIEAANVICRQLELGFALKATLKRNKATSKRFFMFNVHCNGDELSIWMCKYMKVGRCRNFEIAGVQCSTAISDLIVDIEDVQSSLIVKERKIEELRCAIEENCLNERISLTSFPIRRLLMFTSKIWNIGTYNFEPHLRNNEWQWHLCHAHYHSIEDFAEYYLIDISTNRTLSYGHKASFCLEDTGCHLSYRNSQSNNFNCSNNGLQGITPGCYDTYYIGIDCQWIDITNVPSGNYALLINVNPRKQTIESNFHNNLMKCNFILNSISPFLTNITCPS